MLNLAFYLKYKQNRIPGTVINKKYSKNGTTSFEMSKIKQDAQLFEW